MWDIATIICTAVFFGLICLLFWTDDSKKGNSIADQAKTEETNVPGDTLKKHVVKEDDDGSRRTSTTKKAKRTNRNGNIATSSKTEAEVATLKKEPSEVSRKVGSIHIQVDRGWEHLPGWPRFGG